MEATDLETSALKLTTWSAHTEANALEVNIQEQSASEAIQWTTRQAIGLRPA